MHNITVSNKFLQRKFGGTIIYHARDVNKQNPLLFDQNLTRKKYNIPNNKHVIMFFGTPRIHKGLDNLVGAASKLQNKNIFLVIVGLDNDIISQKIKNRIQNLINKNNYILLPTQPFGKIAEIITLCDTYIIPQEQKQSLKFQVPAKLFDAMSMEKNIIATNIGEIPEILKNSGWIIDNNSEIEIINAMISIMNNPKKAREKVKQSRKRCINLYSIEPNAIKLKKIIDSLK